MRNMKTTEIRAKHTADVLGKVCLSAVLAALVLIIVTGSPLVNAFAEGEAETATKLVFQIARGIAIVLGAFFMVFGIIKVAIAHSNENGPEQNKAIMQLAVGLILILFGSIVLNPNGGAGSIYDQIKKLIEGAMDVQ